MRLLTDLRDALGLGPAPRLRAAGDASFLPGRCNVCGRRTRFLYTDPALYRESLTCVHCLTTSRYRSMARGLLEALRRRTGARADSLAGLPRRRPGPRVAVYDTQTPFDAGASAYPIPTLLERCEWIDLALSTWKPALPRGHALGGSATNQDLERLTFADATFDIVLTSDVMEHVRLEDRAHREIRRVLKPGGLYLFTVPHFRDRTTLERVRVVDPSDPSRDVDLDPREYHGDANSEDGRSLSYRSFGVDLDGKLKSLGFDVEYTRRNFPENGILNTELFLCPVVGPPAAAPST
jgi:SAM-dependent methyltransferase